MILMTISNGHPLVYVFYARGHVSHLRSNSSLTRSLRRLRDSIPFVREWQAVYLRHHRSFARPDLGRAQAGRSEEEQV